MIRLLIACLVLSLFMLGCAEIQPPSPKQILTPWSGVAPVQLGESKESIIDNWGEPDEIIQLGADETGLIREEWIYHGRYPDIPIDKKYLSKTKQLIFTGDSLTGYTSEGEDDTAKE